MYLHGETLVSVPLQEMNVNQCLVQQQSMALTHVQVSKAQCFLAGTM